jgi:hypothetical protein
MEVEKCECDRERVCELLGECFLSHKNVAEMPAYMHQQIKNARSVKQALHILNESKHEQATKRKNFRRQKVKNNIGDDRWK